MRQWKKEEEEKIKGEGEERRVDIQKRKGIQWGRDKKEKCPKNKSRGHLENKGEKRRHRKNRRKEERRDRRVTLQHISKAHKTDERVKRRHFINS